MDGREFDALTRRLAEPGTRRSVLKGILGGAAAVAATGAGAALAKPDPEKQVTICHDNNGAGDYSEMRLSPQSAANHLRKHPGDYEGPCVCVEELYACVPGVTRCCGTNICERQAFCITETEGGFCC
jgi:hypothetical protein